MNFDFGFYRRRGYNPAMHHEPSTTEFGFSRRKLFTLASAVGIAAAIDPRLARADPAVQAPATPTPPVQGAGHYTMKIGDIAVSVVSDGGFPLDIAQLFPKTTDAERDVALTAAFRPAGPVPGHVNTLLIKTAGQTVLVDTGCGSLFGPSTGKLRDNLRRLNVAPADITTVILTHFHGDHFGGLLSKGEFPFPNAKVVTHQAEADFWGQNPTLPDSLLPDAAKPGMIAGAVGVLDLLKKQGRLVLNSNEAEIALGVSLVPAFGHTPGHCAVQITSAGQTLLHVTDSVHVPAVQFANPTWQIMFDANPTEAATTRAKLFDRIVADRAMITGSHLAFPGVGYVEKRGTGYGFVQTVWEW